MEEKKKKSCEEAALNKLSYRMRTEKEIRDFLKAEEYQYDEIEATIEFLKMAKYLDDEHYVCEFYRASRQKSWADQRIIKALSEKGIDKAFAKNVIEDYKETDDYNGEKSDEALAKAVAEKMIKDQLSLGKPMDDKFLAKIGRRLASLGYNPGIIYGIINSCKKI